MIYVTSNSHWRSFKVTNLGTKWKLHMELYIGTHYQECLSCSVWDCDCDYSRRKPVFSLPHLYSTWIYFAKITYWFTDTYYKWSINDCQIGKPAGINIIVKDFKQSHRNFYKFLLSLVEHMRSSFYDCECWTLKSTGVRQQTLTTCLGLVGVVRAS